MGVQTLLLLVAQDIAANKFWEAMGFVPLAFRTGSEKKARTHIFWQKRIRAGDVTTPWWFPSQTTGGSLRSDRIVLPIPPGTHWSDAKPMILPGVEVGCGQLAVGSEEKKELPGPKVRRKRAVKAEAAAVVVVAPAVRSTSLAQSGFRFGPPPTVEKPMTEMALAVVPSEPKVKRVKAKNDPRLVAAARELRDRWLDEINASPLIGREKYDVSRAIDGPTRIEVMEPKRLAA
ncbi:MAG: hypothetical protein QM754_11500 [Tepidisphaeraceae bacterium]